MTRHWAVQDAKAKFSEFLRAADREPQVITYRGEPRYELRLLKRSRQSKARKPVSFLEVLRSCPKVPEFKLPERRHEPMRNIFGE
jgi:hypothetical protein